jgi:hypothetical protein
LFLAHPALFPAIINNNNITAFVTNVLISLWPLSLHFLTTEESRNYISALSTEVLKDKKAGVSNRDISIIAWKGLKVCLRQKLC